MTYCKHIAVGVLMMMPCLFAFADNTVVVLLGDDKAGKTLAQMTGADTTASSVAGATSSSAAP